MTSYRLPVKEWPESEQPREKLMALGAEQLSNQELLAILATCPPAPADPPSDPRRLPVPVPTRPRGHR